ncbi:MAG: PhzF family phenazine biosynthesis protein, partial [Candidatus Binatia bacterium]
MRTLPFKQVDVFTQRPLRGNPVAVVIGANGLNSDDMQRLAAWTNLSETTFVLPPTSADADYSLRIFTTKQELPFAGHPVIGSAHAAIESGYAVSKDEKLRQECLAGVIELTVEATDAGRRIFVKIPQPKVTSIGGEMSRGLAAALGAARADHAARRVDVGLVWIVADLGDASAIAAITPKMDAIVKNCESLQATGVTVFGRADDGISALHVRSFAPLLGISEDPVCGSGNASVAAYLIHAGNLPAYGSEYIARQGMEIGRDGRVTVRVRGESIEIGGYAVTCVDGQ